MFERHWLSHRAQASFSGRACFYHHAGVLCSFESRLNDRSCRSATDLIRSAYTQAAADQATFPPPVQQDAAPLSDQQQKQQHHHHGPKPSSSSSLTGDPKTKVRASEMQYPKPAMTLRANDFCMTT
mmetsp:Transcript_19738/g.42792  ORF Transcript_19738/g.42792 Transcript_19738/m.42792 type:complete len:126 (-) Transcript_19738:446-823(-)